MKKIIPHLAVFILWAGIAGGIVHAQTGQITPTGQTGQVSNPSDSSGGAPVTLENPFKGGERASLVDLLTTIINSIIIPLGSILAVLAFIYSGFLYVTSGGDKGKISNAHKAFLNTVIGTAVLLGAWTISTVIANTLKQLQS